MEIKKSEETPSYFSLNTTRLRLNNKNLSDDDVRILLEQYEVVKEIFNF
jgi:hypothetical protein